jgi:hypothetical protein
MTKNLRILWKTGVFFAIGACPVWVAAEDCSVSITQAHVHVSAETIKAWGVWAKAHPAYHPRLHVDVTRTGSSCTQIQTEGDTALRSLSSTGAPFDINLPSHSLGLDSDTHSGSSGSPMAATESAYGGNDAGSPFYPGGYGGAGGSPGNGGSSPGGTGPSGPIVEPPSDGGGTEPPSTGPSGSEPGGGSGNGPGGPSTPTAPTPEPSSLVLLGTGLLGITILFRKSRTKRLD